MWQAYIFEFEFILISYDLQKITKTAKVKKGLFFLQNLVQFVYTFGVLNYDISQYGLSQSEKKLGVGDKYHRSIKVHT